MKNVLVTGASGYSQTPINAFKASKEAEEFVSLCNEEAKRIQTELRILEKEYDDVFIFPDREETEEEIEIHGNRSLELGEKMVKIDKSHKYDSGISDHRSLRYEVKEIDLY